MTKDEAPIDRVQTVAPQRRSRRQVMRAACALAAVLPLGGCEFFETIASLRNTPPPRQGSTGNSGGSGGGMQGGGGGGYGGGY